MSTLYYMDYILRAALITWSHMHLTYPVCTKTFIYAALNIRSSSITPRFPADIHILNFPTGSFYLSGTHFSQFKWNSTPDWLVEHTCDRSWNDSKTGYLSNLAPFGSFMWQNVGNRERTRGQTDRPMGLQTDSEDRQGGRQLWLMHLQPN